MADNRNLLWFTRKHRQSVPPLYSSHPSATPDWDHMPKLLGLRMTARLLSVHPNTLRQWDRTGKLRAHRLGSRHDRRFDRHVIQQLWTERQLVSAPITAHRSKAPHAIITAAVVLGIALVTALVDPWSALAQDAKFVDKTVQPTVCQGWRQAQNAQHVDISGALKPSDFTTKNSASFSTVS